MATETTRQKAPHKDHLSNEGFATPRTTKAKKTKSRTPRVQQEGETELKNAWSFGLDWPGVIWIAVMHIGACVAPFVFAWQSVFLTLGLIWFFGSIGICLSFHRFLTHGSFQTCGGQSAGAQSARQLSRQHRTGNQDHRREAEVGAEGGRSNSLQGGPKDGRQNGCQARAGKEGCTRQNRAQAGALKRGGRALYEAAGGGRRPAPAGLG